MAAALQCIDMASKANKALDRHQESSRHTSWRMLPLCTSVSSHTQAVQWLRKAEVSGKRPAKHLKPLPCCQMWRKQRFVCHDADELDMLPRMLSFAGRVANAWC